MEKIQFCLWLAILVMQIARCIRGLQPTWLMHFLAIGVILLDYGRQIIEKKRAAKILAKMIMEEMEKLSND